MGRPVAPLVERTCEVCPTTFRVKPYERKRYCGYSCSGRVNKAKARDMHGANNPRHNGGLSTTKDGRGLIVCRDGRLMLYARGVVTAHLDRTLSPDELVHHRNGDCSDDRIENLQIVTRAEHLSLHRAEFWEKRKTKREKENA